MPDIAYEIADRLQSPLAVNSIGTPAREKNIKRESQMDSMRTLLECNSRVLNVGNIDTALSQLNSLEEVLRGKLSSAPYCLSDDEAIRCAKKIMLILQKGSVLERRLMP